MRRGVLLHKLILAELVLCMFHGTFIFTNPPVYSCLYFSSKSALFTHTRPYEALFRDPWWIFTVLSLFYNIKSRYDFDHFELMRVSPRFAVVLGAMVLSICFLLLDNLAVTNAIKATALPDGIQPFWKLAFVFRCICDVAVLDRFKEAPDRLKAYKMKRMGSVLSDGVRGDFSFDEQAKRKKEVAASPLDISNPDEFVRRVEHSQYPPLTRDWSRPTNGANEILDLEAALRDVKPEVESSKHGISGWVRLRHSRSRVS
ncbi:hypothetical protein LTR95_011323 [Oleoguttula sp. CCFEE 5521]